MLSFLLSRRQISPPKNVSIEGIEHVAFILGAEVCVSCAVSVHADNGQKYQIAEIGVQGDGESAAAVCERHRALRQSGGHADDKPQCLPIRSHLSYHGQIIACARYALYNEENDNMDVEELGMKYLAPELLAEYERISKDCEDIPGLAPPYVNVSDTLKAYFILADYFTDTSSGSEVECMLVNVRSIDLLASALSRQVVSYGGKQKYSEPLEICSTLFFGMVKNHAFSDGNKRTALLILLYQLGQYNYMPAAPVTDFERLVLAVASSTLSTKYPYDYKKAKKKDDPNVATITLVLRKLTKKKDNTYHLAPTFKEFCAALNNQNVACNVKNDKMHFSRKIKKTWFGKMQEVNYSVPFAGWTRTVGAKTARDILKHLELYDPFASYQELIDGKEPMYALIEKFEGPLRRLKDE